MINKITSNKKNILIFLLIATFITSFSLLLSKMYWGHDLVFHLSRIRAIKDNLNLGVVGGYMYPNYLDGYGYGNPLFYPDIFLYIPAIISYLGLSILSSYKLFLVLINFLTFLTMYITIKSITGNKKSAIVSSIMYGCASYKQIDMYTRAALGETLSFIFIPLIILGIYEIIYRDKNKFYILVIGMSGLILCHLISTYLICIVLGADTKKDRTRDSIELIEYAFKTFVPETDFRVSSLFIKEGVLKGQQVKASFSFSLKGIVNRGSFVYFERLPVGFHPVLMQYELADFAFTDWTLQAATQMVNLYQLEEEGKIVQLF